METFFLGTHKAVWLSRTDVPLFISHRTLMDRKRLPRALGPWALDSGGFTELSTCVDGCVKHAGAYNAATGFTAQPTFSHSPHGWKTSPVEYVDATYRYADEIGNLVWAAPQDWMCEPAMLEMTGKTISEHQKLTVESFCRLRALAPDLPFAPVLQGWEVEDYEFCISLYEAHGVLLQNEPIVGVGSVCRRQKSWEIEGIMRSLAGHGIKLHGFGVKTAGLAKYSPHLHSADSMAWSFNARSEPPLPGHTHKSCANCLEYALAWRERLLRRAGNHQMMLDF